MSIKVNKKIKGAGEFIGFTIASIILTGFLVLLLGCGELYATLKSMDEGVQDLGRAAVVCTSLEDAQKTVQEQAEKMFSGNQLIQKNSIKTNISYVTIQKPKSSDDTSQLATQEDQKSWTKGNYICVTLTAQVKTTTPVTSGKKGASTTMMIERNGM